MAVENWNGTGSYLAVLICPSPLAGIEKVSEPVAHSARCPTRSFLTASFAPSSDPPNNGLKNLEVDQWLLALELLLDPQNALSVSGWSHGSLLFPIGQTDDPNNGEMTSFLLIPLSVLEDPDSCVLLKSDPGCDFCGLAASRGGQQIPFQWSCLYFLSLCI